MKFLRRYLDEQEPTLKNFAKVGRALERLAPGRVGTGVRVSVVELVGRRHDSVPPWL